MIALKWSWRQLAREWRAGELRTLAAALLVAVAAMSAVTVFTARVDRAMEAGAAELLAADMAVISRLGLPPEWQTEARNQGLETARVLTFPSVVLSGDRTQLAAVKATSGGYPLRGQLRISQNLFDRGEPTSNLPEPGTAWADARLFSMLELSPGDTVDFGDIQLTLTEVLSYEPDQEGSLFNLAPRLLVSLEDSERAGLLGPGSRVTWRLLVAGEAQSVTAFKTWLEPRLESGHRIERIEDAQQEVSSALERADRFLRLAALTAVLVSAVAIIIAARRYSRRHHDTIAILRCLGASQATALAAVSLQLLWLALPAVLIGGVLGYLAQLALAEALTGLTPNDLPAAGIVPVLPSVGLGLLLVMGFALPALLRLRRIPPARVLNRALGQVKGRDVLGYALPAVAALALIVWQVRDLELLGWVLGGSAITLVVLSIVSALLIAFLRRTLSNAGAAWRYGLANLARRRGSSIVQVSGLGIGLLAILLLSVVRTELLAGWQQSLPEDTPNYFLLNIQPHQVEDVERFLSERGLAGTELYPMAVSQLVAINGETPDPDAYSDPRAQWRIRGNPRFSWADTLPAANTITRGQFWEGVPAEPELSVAESWAEPLQLELGDTLSFKAGDQTVTGTITSLREVQWDSFNVNFFLLFSPDSVGDVPRTYITSFHLENRASETLTELVRTFPNISIIDIDAILAKVREVIGRVSVAVQFVFVFTVAAGLLVLLAAIQSTLDARRFEAAVLRTLGAGRRRLQAGIATEFGALGLVAGTLATASAAITGWLLATRVFQIEYAPGIWLFVFGLIGATVGITLAGLAGTGKVLNTSPIGVLRRH